VVIVTLALLAALTFGFAVVLQKHAAVEVPDELAGRPALLVRLVQRPLWLLGLVASIGGFGLQAAALQHGSLIVVQPLITTSLLFTLLLASAWYHEAISPSEWLGVGLVLGGLVIFLALAAPSEHSLAVADASGWLALVAAVVVTTGVTVSLGLRATGRTRAALLGVAAGISDAFMAVLAKAFTDSFHHGVGGVFLTWTPYALVVAGITALLLTSTAYQAGHPTVSLPIITVLDPLVGSVIGVLLFGEHLGVAGVRGPIVVLAIAVMAVGLVSLGRDLRLAEVMSETDPAA
jgi:drug/metabolite transporter (DMT)-like permease